MSFGATAVYIAAASAVISAAGAVYQGQQGKKVAEYNAQVAENQANAESAEAREGIKRKREENKSFLSRQLALRAKSGVGIETGSSLLLAAESAKRLELSALEMGRSAESRRNALLQSASISRFEGQSAVTSSYFSAGASLLKGAGGIAAYMAEEEE